MDALLGRDLLGLADLTAPELQFLLNLSAQLKSGQVQPQTHKVLGLIFSKASTRTRVSFTAAMYRMGGQVVDLNLSTTQLSRGEPIPDTARVLSRYLDVVAIRTYAQVDIELFAQYADIPVINALTDDEHPCQILADLLTVQEAFGQLAGLTMTYVGDGNNVAHSLMLGCALAGMNIRVACPEGHQPEQVMTDKAKAIAGDRSQVNVLNDPEAAVKDAHVLYTDVWASMGQEDLADTRIPLFQPYQLNDALMSLADPDAIVLHCLPAHRGEEITESVLEGPRSRVWDQAENRLHTQQALLAEVLGAEY